MALIKKFRIKKFKDNKPVASLYKVSLSYGKRQILDNINLELSSGEIVGLLGPNGAGKSTLFNLLIGLIKPNFGKIIIGNKDVTNYPIYERAKKFNIGFVPQNGGYFHDLTLLDNLKAVGEIIIKEKRLLDSKINELLTKFLDHPLMPYI